MVQPKNVLIEKSVIIENATSFFFFLALIVKPRFWYVVIAIELCPNFKRSVRFTERKRENLLKKRKQTNRVCVETIKMQEFPEIRLHYGKNALSNEKLFYAMRNETIRYDAMWTEREWFVCLVLQSCCFWLEPKYKLFHSMIALAVRRRIRICNGIGIRTENGVYTQVSHTVWRIFQCVKRPGWQCFCSRYF